MSHDQKCIELHRRADVDGVVEETAERVLVFPAQVAAVSELPDGGARGLCPKKRFHPKSRWAARKIGGLAAGFLILTGCSYSSGPHGMPSMLDWLRLSRCVADWCVIAEAIVFCGVALVRVIASWL